MSKNTNVVSSDTEVLNAEKFFRQLDRLTGASIGVIAIRTREAERAKTLVHEWSSMRGMDFHAWDRIKGFWRYLAIPVVDAEDSAEDPYSLPELSITDPDKMEEYTKPHEGVQNTDDVLQALGHFRIRREDGSDTKNKFVGVFIGIDDQDIINPVFQQEVRDHVTRAYNSDDRMVFILPLGLEIPAHMQSDIEVIDMPPPSFAELMIVMDDNCETFKEAIGWEPDEDDKELVVQNGIGMTEQEFSNALALSVPDLSLMRRDDPDFEVSAEDVVGVVRNRKMEVLKQTQMLELMTPINIDKVGGLDELKTSLKKQRRAFSPEAREYGIKLPKGFLAVGVPGGGKTLIGKAASHVLGIPAVRFDMAAVYQGLVGSSEANMRTALRMLEDMAPVICFIDEIEKAIGGENNDSGTSQRVLGTFLTWMNDRADRQAAVYVIATANDVTRLPPELLRKGRFDEKWAITFPTKSERAAIFKIHVEMRKHKFAAKDYAYLASLCENYVGAEIEGIIEEALLEDFYNGEESLQVETVKKYIEATVPQWKAFPARIAAMRDWATNNARMASSTGSFGVEIETDNETGEKKVKALPKVKRRPGSGRGLRGMQN